MRQLRHKLKIKKWTHKGSNDGSKGANGVFNGDSGDYLQLATIAVIEVVMKEVRKKWGRFI